MTSSNFYEKNDNKLAGNSNSILTNNYVNKTNFYNNRQCDILIKDVYKRKENNPTIRETIV